jgi:acyl-CoA synthetase (AMP-forming)/AMP-acid ligase II
MCGTSSLYWLATRLDIRYVRAPELSKVHISYAQLRYQAFLPSARNSKEAFLHLLQVTQCRKFICSAEKRQKVLELSNFTEALQVSEIPSLDEMLSSEVVAYNYRNTYEEDKDKVSFVIHSSGTTGMLMDRKRLSVVQSIGY